MTLVHYFNILMKLTVMSTSHSILQIFFRSYTCNFGSNYIGLFPVTTYLQVNICLLICIIFTFSLKTSTKEVRHTSMSQPNASRPFIKWRIRTNFVTKVRLFNFSIDRIFRGCHRQPLYCFHLDFRCVTLVRYIYIYIYI